MWYYTEESANCLQRLKTKILTAFARLIRFAGLLQLECYDESYPQFWYCLPRSKTLRKPLQFLCGLLGGHELSKTEWGYGGGPYADRWCRWCDKRVEVPLESVFFMRKEAKELVKLLGVKIDDEC